MRFVGGVRDADGKRAFIPAAADSVVAVDLKAGAMLWRRERIGLPIAATASRLVTLEAAGKRFVLRLVNAATGSDVGRVTDFGMPDWAGEIGTAVDAVDVETNETPTGIRLEWRLRRPYRGGAPRPLQSQSRDENTGAILLDVDSAHVRPANEASERPALGETNPDLGPHARAAPEKVAFDRVGETLFTLKAPVVSGRTHVSLEARNAGDGKLLWEVPLSQEESGRPAPQRK